MRGEKMGFKRHVPYFLVVIILAAYLLALAVLSVSCGADIVDAFSALTGHSKVAFGNGTRIAADEEHITVVLQDGETALLDSFENLRSADLSGSECYEEIAAWKNSHPGTSVKYTVAFPNGSVAGNEDTSVSLTGLNHDDVSRAVQLLQYLPGVRSIDVGNSDSSPSLTSADIDLISGACPDAQVAYSLRVLGKEYSLNEENVDFSGITSAQLQSEISKLSALKNIRSIIIGNNATQNGELSWDDISLIASTWPDAALSYDFSVLGTQASLSDTFLDLQAITPADVDTVAKILPGMTQLEKIDIGSELSGLTLEDVGKLYAAAPDIIIDYDMSVMGKIFSLEDEILDFNHIYMPDNGAYVKSILPYCKNCKCLDMDSCGKGEEFNQAMAAIQEEFPNIDVVWRIWFGENYSVRTNVTKILASKPSKGGKLYNDDALQLRYCTKVRYLDLGHNDNISDFSFVSYMPDLEIIVMSMTGVSDLTPFANCKHLKYIEAGNTNISDLSPLAYCTELCHLNIGTCPGVTDLSPLFDLPMRRLWLCTNSGQHCTNYSSEQAAQFAQLHPECEVNTTCPTGYGNEDAEGYVKEGWKYWQQYLTSDWDYYGRTGYFPAQRPLGYWKVVYKAFEYNLNEGAYAFSWNDPKYNEHDASVLPVNTNVINTSRLSEAWEAPEDNVIEDVLTDPPGEILYTVEY